MIPQSLISQEVEKREGQALVEAIVALSVLMIGYIAVLGLLNRSLATSSLVSDQNIATYLAAEGIEVVKNLTDANISSGEDYHNDFQIGSYEVYYGTVLEDSDSGVDPDNDNPGKRISQSTESSLPLLFDLNDGYNYLAGTPTRFFRTVRVMPPAPAAGRMHVISIVKWQTKGGGSSVVQLEDFFFKP